MGPVITAPDVEIKVSVSGFVVDTPLGRFEVNGEDNREIAYGYAEILGGTVSDMITIDLR